MRALILQFESLDPPGLLGEHLLARGVAWDAAQIFEPHSPFTLDGYDMLVALGGAMGANDANDYTFLDEAEDLIRRAVARGTPYLGICLGGQLLAHALGAQVRPNAGREVGLIELIIDPAASNDPLLKGVPHLIETVQFHQDTFELPPGAVLLASSALCANQIARCGDRAYALQFHPEASWQCFATWIESSYADFVGPRPAVSGETLVESVRRHDTSIRAHATTLFDNFVNLATQAHSAR